MAATLRWYGDRIEAGLRRSAQAGVARAAHLVATQGRLLANRPARRIRRRRKRNTSAGRRGSQYTEFIGSAPGQPPMVRTAFGRRNIAVELYPAQYLARIGVRVNAAYMIYLEVGTEYIAPRPWLKPALERSLPAVQALLAASLREAG